MRPQKAHRDTGLYKKGRRYYLAWHMPGEGPQHMALIPAGQTRATTELDVARVLRTSVLASGMTAAQVVARRRSGRPIPHARTLDELPAEIDRLVDDFAAYNARRYTATQGARNKTKVRAFLIQQGIRHVQQISPATIAAHLEKLETTDKLKASTVAKSQAAISSFCKFLILRGLLEHNPARDVPAPKIVLPPPRFLNEDEYDQALQIANDEGVLPEVGTALCTGMRLGELRRLDWSDIRWADKSIVLTVTKTKRPRTIPMAAKLVDLLDTHARGGGKRQRPKTGLVFSDDGQPRTDHWWRHALDQLKDKIAAFGQGDEDSRAWHLFRHTFASRLVAAGVPIRQVADWMGHVTIATTMRYAHLAPGYSPQIEEV